MISFIYTRIIVLVICRLVTHNDEVDDNNINNDNDNDNNTINNKDLNNNNNININTKITIIITKFLLYIAAHITIQSLCALEDKERDRIGLYIPTIQFKSNTK